MASPKTVEYTIEDQARDNVDFKKEVFDKPEGFLQTGTLFFHSSVPLSVRDHILDMARVSDPITPLANTGGMLYGQRAYIWRIINPDKPKMIIYKKDSAL